MKVKLIKILVLAVIMILILGTAQVLAINPNDYKPDISNDNSTTFKTKVEKILGVINVVGIVCSVVVIVVIGLKYMLGSVEEKAEYKKTMTTYMIGAVLLFSGTTIPNIIYETADMKNKPTRPYRTETGTWYWCKECDRELTEGEVRARECDVSRSHAVDVRRERYYCTSCGDEWDEGERRQQGCDQCRSR